MQYFICIHKRKVFQYTRLFNQFMTPYSNKPIPRIAKPVKHNSIPPLCVWEGITVKELACAAKRSPYLVLQSINSGMMLSGKADLNFKLQDRKLLVSLVHLLGFKAVFKHQSRSKLVDKDAKPRPPADPALCFPRPPVVAVLGHVDHGKTTLLDALRASRVVDAEFGGITQHLAAFTVSLSAVAMQAGLSGLPATIFETLSDHITFLDTPGHAAFSGIRERGAVLTDMIVLVVAADDGVMPQTVESIRFAKRANTPIVVAINKIDKCEANVESVIQELAAHDVVVEKLGGDVQAVEISALHRRNLHHLLEAICVQAELMQLRAEPSGPAEAVVLEANVEGGTGKVATCLVTRGTLCSTPKSGPLVAGEAVCSPRFLLDDAGQRVSFVKPGYVAKVPGWKELPPAGSLVLELPTVQKAHEVIRYRTALRMEQMSNNRNPHTNVADLAGVPETSACVNSISLPLMVKTDTHGTLEAIKALLYTCPSHQCIIEFCQSSVGPLTLSEVANAEAVGATILLFNVDALSDAQKYAEDKGICIRHFNIIYRLAEEVRELINARLPPVVVEKVVGEAEVLALFTVRESRGSAKPLRLPVAGCRCTKGYLVASTSSLKSLPERSTFKEVLGTYYRVIRPNKSVAVGPNTEDGNNPADPLHTGTVLVSQAVCHSLKHERSTVDSIRKNVECGLALTSPETEASSGDLSKVDSRSPSSSGEVFFSDWQVGDLIQCYALLNEVQSLDWNFDLRSSET